MAVTIPVQTRLSHDIAKALDARAAQTGTTRAEVVRALLEAALAEPLPVEAARTTDPLLDRICDELGILIAKVDAGLIASRSAHAAARLAALMLLPQERQAVFVEKLGKAVQP